jgi:hypothetical protein
MAIVQNVARSPERQPLCNQLQALKRPALWMRIEGVLI